MKKNNEKLIQRLKKKEEKLFESLSSILNDEEIKILNKLIETSEQIVRLEI